MATIRNARDIILQAASIRLLPVSLPPNVVVEVPNLSPEVRTIIDLPMVAINAMASDSIFSPVEKALIRKEWEAIASEKAILEAQATTYQITTEKAAYTAAFQALATYLNAGVAWVSDVPAWISDANLGAQTNIVGTTFRLVFKAYYDGKTLLLKKVTDAANAATKIINDETALYRQDVPPTNNVVPVAIEEIDNPDGSRDIVLSWTYSQGAIPADGLGIFYVEGAGAVSVTDPVVVLTVGCTSYRFVGVSQAFSYRAGMVAYRKTESGIRRTAIVQPVSAPDWRVTGNTPNITALIDGVTAASVVGGSAQGAITYQGTVNYRSAGAPSANPAPSGITLTNNTNGSRDIRLDWSAYTQGAIKADMLVLFYKEGAAAVTINDAAIAMNVNETAGSYYIFPGTDPAKSYRAGIAAARKTENGLELGAIIQPLAAPNWNPAADTANYTANVDGVAAATLLANLNTATANAAAAMAGVDNIVSDSILSAAEKPGVRKEWDIIASEKAVLVAQAGTYGVSVTSYNSGFQVLATYLNAGVSWSSGIPSWISDANLDTNTAIVGATFRANAKAYYDGKVALLRAVTDAANTDISAAATTANWTGVASRPTTLAGLNATEGGKLGGIAAGATVNTGLFATLSGVISATNYASYVGANAFSVLGFSQNKTTSAGTLNTSISFNSSGQNVVAIISAGLSSAKYGNASGSSGLWLNFKVGGVVKFNDTAAVLVDESSDQYSLVSGTIAVLITSPGAGAVTYTLTATLSHYGIGTGPLIYWPTIQLFGLKR